MKIILIIAIALNILYAKAKTPPTVDNIVTTGQDSIYLIIQSDIGYIQHSLDTVTSVLRKVNDNIESNNYSFDKLISSQKVHKKNIKRINNDFKYNTRLLHDYGVLIKEKAYYQNRAYSLTAFAIATGVLAYISYKGEQSGYVTMFNSLSILSAGFTSFSVYYHYKNISTQTDMAELFNNYIIGLEYKTSF